MGIWCCLRRTTEAAKGMPLVPASQTMRITRALPHGHVVATHTMAVKLGLPSLLGLASIQRQAFELAGN
jgi:hypothetical protein